MRHVCLSGDNIHVCHCDYSEGSSVLFYLSVVTEISRIVVGKQKKTTVTAYLKSKQLLLFVFAQ